MTRPSLGEVETRALDLTPAEPNKLAGRIPYGVESRDLGGWTEVIDRGALDGADLGDLVATVDHAGVPLARYPQTLTVENRADGLHWSLVLPESRADVREAVARGDLRSSSWRMVVAKDRWVGTVRHIEQIGALLDVSVVTTPAYPTAPAELRELPHPTTHEEASPVEPTEAVEAVSEAAEANIAPSAGTLRVEERSATPEAEHAAPPIERLADEIRSVNKGEARSLTNAISLSQTELSTMLIDKLRASSVALRSGIQVKRTDHESIQYPRITADASPSWTDEGDPIANTDPTFSTITATPQKLAALVELTNEVIDDSDPSVIEILNAHLTGQIGLALDLGIFEGSGAAPEIEGLQNITGIQTVSMGNNGAALTNLDPFADAIYALEAENATPGAFVMNPRTWATVRKLKDTQNRPLVDASVGTTDLRAAIYGVPVYVTSQLSITEDQGTATGVCSSVYLYDTSQVHLVVRNDVVVEVDRSRLFHQDKSEVRAKLRADLMVPNVKAVCRILGIKP